MGERTRKERRRRKEEKSEKWEKGRGKREEGERKRNVRSGGKEEKLLAVFVSGRRIGMCGGGWLSWNVDFFLA